MSEAGPMAPPPRARVPYSCTECGETFFCEDGPPLACHNCESRAKWLATCSEDCSCCDDCQPSVCAGVTGGGVCDQVCVCEDQWESA